MRTPYERGRDNIAVCVLVFAAVCLLALGLIGCAAAEGSLSDTPPEVWTALLTLLATILALL